MQLGVRWRAGDPPHSSVPEVLHAEIAQQELQHPTATAWTLTWLEGRPRCALDDEVVVGLAQSGAVTTSPGAASGMAAGLSGAGNLGVDSLGADSLDDDDDDWLS